MRTRISAFPRALAAVGSSPAKSAQPVSKRVGAAAILAFAALVANCGGAPPPSGAPVVKLGTPTASAAPQADPSRPKSAPCAAGKEPGCFASLAPACAVSHIGDCKELPSEVAEDFEDAPAMFANCRGGSAKDCAFLGEALRGQSQIECARDIAEKGCKLGGAGSCRLAAELTNAETDAASKACATAFWARTCDFDPTDPMCPQLVTDMLKPAAGDWWTPQGLLAALCEAKNGAACFELADSMTDKDSDKYVELLLDSCAADSSDGCDALAERNLAKCVLKDALSCQLLSADATRYLTRIDANGAFYPDIPKAVSMSEAACKQNYLTSCSILVEIYRNGVLVGPVTANDRQGMDAEKARRWAEQLAKACEEGKYDDTDASECLDLATMIEKGEVLKKNAARAAKIRKVACGLSKKKPCPPKGV